MRSFGGMLCASLDPYLSITFPSSPTTVLAIFHGLACLVSEIHRHSATGLCGLNIQIQSHYVAFPNFFGIYSGWLSKSLEVLWSDLVFILCPCSTAKLLVFYVGPPLIMWLVSLFWYVGADVHLFQVINTNCKY